jgi:hypothetical protein
VAISKKIRFEVFKRDGFRCAYCGKTPPEVVLEADHIDPKANCGCDSIDNLLTACFDCNRGKRNIPLDKIPSTLSENIEVIREREEQIKEHRKLLDSIERRKKKDIKAIADTFKEYFPNDRLTDTFQKSSVKLFLSKLPIHEVVDAMNIACSRRSDSSLNAVKYFCGICWSKIKGTAKYQ